MNDPILCYFVFQEYNIAVALRQGDILIFDPSQWHCLSSCIRTDDEYLSLTCYLKSRVVGLNDNQIPLAPHLKQYIRPT